MPFCLPTLTLDPDLVNLTLDPDLVEMLLVGCYGGEVCAITQFYAASCISPAKAYHSGDPTVEEISSAGASSVQIIRAN